MTGLPHPTRRRGGRGGEGVGASPPWDSESIGSVNDGSIGSKYGASTVRARWKWHACYRPRMIVRIVPLFVVGITMVVTMIVWRKGSTANESIRNVGITLASDIEALENELTLLSVEFRELSEEITQLVTVGDSWSAHTHQHEPQPDVIIFDAVKDDDREGMVDSEKHVTRNEAFGIQSSNDVDIKTSPRIQANKGRQSREKKNGNRHRKEAHKKYWIRANLSFTDDRTNAQNDFSAPLLAADAGAIIPFDLSVNHLQRIISVPGSPIDNNSSQSNLEEEFLPVVQTHTIDFRWRSRSRPDSRPGDATRTTAYRIITRRAQYSSSLDDGDNGEVGKMEEDPLSSTLIWDSGKVSVPDGLPDVVHCSDTELSKMIGSIIEWRVTVWDSSKPEPRWSTSHWTKFAIGPTQKNDITSYDNDQTDDDTNGWKARWISHPIDVDSWDKTDGKAFWNNNAEDRETACRNWEKRSQLPLFRTKFTLPTHSSDDDEIISALLVVSGLGSFRASLDGVPLSSSGPLDPPFTDFSRRVSYRGFDVTKFLKTKMSNRNSEGEHVVGISMGSGWWDHRPLTGDFIRLFYFPRGAVTCIAQLYVTYKKSGKPSILIPTGNSLSEWQTAKGHLRESSLFSGEYIDLQSMAMLEGWDTLAGWGDTSSSSSRHQTSGLHSWVEPKLYKSDMTLESWQDSLHIRAHAKEANLRKTIFPDHTLSPIGKLVPHEIPPILPIERIYPDEIYGLGHGRWMIDFGKGISGMVRFDSGLSAPIVPSEYPRGHSVSTLSPDESFITVLYGESLQMETGDINIALVAGMGLHDGGPRHKVKGVGYVEAKGGPCYPKDHIKEGTLLQRDVYILPRNEEVTIKGTFLHARQSQFTTHSFRFAEICCLAKPPSVHAMSYRTAFNEWGDFGSSNTRINGGYELTKNALNSNMLGVQSDCPHREKIQYGGDLIANSPSALHLYDLSSFYRKVINDWKDQQWDNGAYAGSSIWLALNDYAGVGYGSGETVWASAPVVLTARHFQHYGDLKLLEETFDNHVRWFDFLRVHFDKGLIEKEYPVDLKGYTRAGSGLGDWLSLRGRDTWLTHQSFYMASARCVAYIASKLGMSKDVDRAIRLADDVRERIARLYLREDGSFLPPEASQLSPGPEMSLFSRVVPGDKRCLVLRNYLKRKGHSWPGSEENAFLAEINETSLQQMISSGELTKRDGNWSMGWSQWHGFNEGILAVRYALKTLSDNGFHNIALSKANGLGIGTFEYMLSHNATTLWESWWRSEDLYSHNHPMLGASAEWMVAAVAGVSLHPVTTGGKRVLFWPRFPNSASTLEYAGATQGTRRGDFSVAWRFEGLPNGDDLYDSAIVKICIRLYVPPDGAAIFRLPEYGNGRDVDCVIRFAMHFPDMSSIKHQSSQECNDRRKTKDGFNYNWEYDRKEKQWTKVYRKKAIGTPCQSYLFHSLLTDVAWSSSETVRGNSETGIELELGPGLYDVVVMNWQLKPEIKGKKDWRIESMYEFYAENEVSRHCSDVDTFNWNLDDATHLI